MGGHEQTVGQSPYIDRLFGAQPFRADVSYHGTPSMAAVAMATADELHIFGLKQNADAGQLRYKVGILVDEDKRPVFSQIITTEQYKVMEEEAAKHPGEAWIDIKRRVFLFLLSNQDAQVKLPEPVFV